MKLLYLIAFSTLLITGVSLCMENDTERTTPTFREVAREMMDSSCCFVFMRCLLGIKYKKKKISLGGLGAARRNAYKYSDPCAFEDSEDETD